MDGGAELDALSIGLSGMHGTRAMVGRAACRCAMLIWTHIIDHSSGRQATSSTARVVFGARYVRCRGSRTNAGRACVCVHINNFWIHIHQKPQEE
jgi:hypothetical protein